MRKQKALRNKLLLFTQCLLCFQYDEQFSKEIEEAWGSLCGSQWVNNVHEILAYLIALAGVIGSSEVLVHVSHTFCFDSYFQSLQGQALRNKSITYRDTWSVIFLKSTIYRQIDLNCACNYF